MKKIYALLIGLLPFASAFSQTIWNYNFGTGTGTHTAASSTILSTGGGYLPSTETNGGVAMSRVGGGGGGFHLENPSIIGAGSHLRFVGTSSGSVNKFAITDYTAATTFTLKFNIRFDGASAGTAYLFAGDGASFSGNSGFTGAQVFTGLRFVYGASDAITTSHRSAGAWVAGPSSFAQKTDYIVEIYGNNSNATANYTYSGPQSVAANTFDLWVNGLLVGDNMAKGQLGNNVNVDSWMIYTENAGSTIIYLDEIRYANGIVSPPLPISLLSFHATKIAEKVQLTWSTATEIKNEKFIIERSADGEKFEEVGTVKGAGDSKEINNYKLIDNSPLKGISYYRLKQVDFDGTSETFAPVAVKTTGKSIEVIKAQATGDVLNLNIYAEIGSVTEIRIVDMNGRLVGTQIIELTSGYQDVQVNTSNLNSGIHLIQLKNNEEVVMKKMIF